MPYQSRFTYVDSLPADAEKVENIRDRTPRELYWSPGSQKFYHQYLKDGKVARVRELTLGKKGYIYARTTEGKSICIVFNKWLRDKGLTPITESN